MSLAVTLCKGSEPHPCQLHWEQRPVLQGILNGLPRDCPSLETFETHLEVFLCHLPW